MVFSPQDSEPVDDGADKGYFKVFLPSSTFEVLVLFHALCLIINHQKDVIFKVPYKYGMGVAFAISKVLSEGMEGLLDSTSLSSWGSFVELFLIFDHQCGLLKLLRRSSEGIFAQSQRGRFWKRDSPRDPSVVCPFSFHCEYRKDAAFEFLAVFMRTKLRSVIKDAHLFTVPQNSLNEGSLFMALSIPSVVLPLLFATFSSFSAAGLIVSIHAALGAALKHASSNTKLTNVLIFFRSSERTEDSVFFAELCVKTMNLASTLIRRRGKHTPGSKSALKRCRKRYKDLWGFSGSWCEFRKNRFLPQTSGTFAWLLKVFPQFYEPLWECTVVCLTQLAKNCWIPWRQTLCRRGLISLWQSLLITSGES